MLADGWGLMVEDWWHFENAVIIDTDHPKSVGILFKYQHQFFTLIVDTDNVYFSNMFKVVDSLTPVEHR